MFSKVFVPLDGSELAESALEYAKAICDGKIHLFRVQPYPPISSLPLDMPATQAMIEAEKNATTSYLEKTSYKLAAEGNVHLSWSQKMGDPASSILQEAREEGADCIVMSSHGRTGWSRFLLGSVAEKVVRHATCPVLIVRPPAAASA